METTAPLTEYEKSLQRQFPGYISKEIYECEGIHAVILTHEHSREEHPCYSYGYRIADDINHTFSTRLLLAPVGGAPLAQPGHVIVQLRGYSLVSERYDQESRSISCELASGERMGLDHQYYYEKYAWKTEHQAGPLVPLLAYLRGHLGYAALTEDQLGHWVQQVRGHFSY